MTLHQGQLLEIGAHIPNSGRGVAARSGQLFPIVVEGQVQDLVIVSSKCDQARVHFRVPHFGRFIHRRRGDQRAIEVVNAVR